MAGKGWRELDYMGRGNEEEHEGHGHTAICVCEYVLAALGQKQAWRNFISTKLRQ
jgi:hypothetical protein